MPLTAGGRNVRWGGGAAFPAPTAPGSGWPAPHRPTLQLASQGRGRWLALAFVGGAAGAGGPPSLPGGSGVGKAGSSFEAVCVSTVGMH